MDQTALSTATPVEVDAHLVEQLDAIAKQTATRARRMDHVHAIARDVRRGSRGWLFSDEEAVRKATRIATAPESSGTAHHAASLALSRLSEASDLLEGTRSTLRAIDDEYDRRPWTRFVHVPNGHVHGRLGCSTLRPTTRFNLRADLSGTSAAAAVEQLGAILCTICFPGAPVEWTSGRPDPEGTCSGSKEVPLAGTEKYYGRSLNGRCPGCSTMQVVTLTGVVRKHKKPAV